MGAAAATLAAYLAWNAMRGYFSAVLYDLHFEVKRLCLVTLLAAALFGAGVRGAAQVGGWIGLILKTLAIVAYPALLVATG